jgi:CRISPR-associated protein Csd1
LSPDLGTRFVGAALRGRAFPRELIGASLRRIRLPAEKNDRNLLHDRIALIKATWLRLYRPRRNKEELVSLDESTTTPAYLLGRLFAVLERLQAAALGDVNASIRDRYFGAASSTPALVFPRLIRLGMHHAAKAEHSGWLEKITGQIVGALPAQRFPAVLSLEDQGLFAVGYYHQRERFFEKKKEQ